MKCRWKRGRARSQSPMSRVLWVAVLSEDEVDFQRGGHRRLDGVEEGVELGAAMARLAGADDRAGPHVQGGEEVQGAVALVVMGVPFGPAGAQRQHGRRALQGLDLWGFSSTACICARSGGRRYRPMTSRPLSTKAGSLESLKVSARWGWRPKARHTRLTIVWLIPERAAMLRVLQGVASLGWLSRVRATRRSTSASPTVRGAPGRGASERPARRCSAKRPRHSITLGRLTFKVRATALLVAPGSAQASTMRARVATAWLPWARRVQRLSSASSSTLRCSGLALGPGGSPHLAAVAPFSKLTSNSDH